MLFLIIYLLLVIPDITIISVIPDNISVIHDIIPDITIISVIPDNISAIHDIIPDINIISVIPNNIYIYIINNDI